MEKYARKLTGTVFLKWEKTEVSIWETKSAQRKTVLKKYVSTKYTFLWMKKR